MLALTEDTTKGAHDTLISACDAGRYRALGVEGYHPSCTDNYKHALLASEMVSESVSLSTPPSPLNLFMNVPIRADGSVSFQVPSSEAGQYVCLRALMDVIVVMSACPMDLRATNNWNPSDAHYAILGEK